MVERNFFGIPLIEPSPISTPIKLSPYLQVILAEAVENSRPAGPINTNLTSQLPGKTILEKIKGGFTQRPKDPIRQTGAVIGDVAHVIESGAHTGAGVTFLGIAAAEVVEGLLTKDQNRKELLNTSATLRAKNATMVLENSLFNGLGHYDGEAKKNSALVYAIPQLVDDSVILLGEGFGLVQKLNPFYQALAIGATIELGLLSKSPIGALKTFQFAETMEMKSKGIARIFGILALSLQANKMGLFDQIEPVKSVIDGLHQVAIAPVVDYAVPALLNKVIEVAPWAFDSVVQILSGLSGNK